MILGVHFFIFSEVDSFLIKVEREGDTKRTKDREGKQQREVIV